MRMQKSARVLPEEKTVFLILQGAQRVAFVLDETDSPGDDPEQELFKAEAFKVLRPRSGSLFISYFL